MLGRAATDGFTSTSSMPLRLTTIAPWSWITAYEPNAQLLNLDQTYAFGTWARKEKILLTLLTLAKQMRSATLKVRPVIQ